jgi:uncharacterized phage protein (TIGR01671 family)
MKLERGMWRGKDRVTGEWIIGWKVVRNASTRHYSLTCIVRYEETDDMSDWYWYEVDPSTLGEWTGMYDKNGEPIFEGDIITFHQFLFDGCEIESILTALVEYDEEDVCFALKRIENDFYQDYTGYRRGEGSAPICFFYGLHEESFTKMGNKWDNPDLLGVEL